MKAIKMSASWCMPCKMLTAQLLAEGIVLEEVDVDENKELAKRYGVRSIPTIVILDDDGNRMDSFVGAGLNPVQIKRLKDIV